MVGYGFAIAPTKNGRIEGFQVVLENVTLQRQEELQKFKSVSIDYYRLSNRHSWVIGNGRKGKSSANLTSSLY